MIVGIRDAAKLVGISIITCCASLVCTMFLNYYLDIRQMESLISSEQASVLYAAQVSTAKMTCAVSGGCLLATAVVMLFFYIKHYIDTHKKELGICKALGVSNLKIAGSFWVFGLSVLIGTAAGFCGAFLVMPRMYEESMNLENLLPEIPVRFHPAVFLYFVVLPTVIFSLLSVLYAFCQLKQPVIGLLKDMKISSFAPRKQGKDEARQLPFIEDLKKNTLKSRKTLAFFVVFASFCFSAMTQMAAGMKDLSSTMMAVMILVIGLILAFTTLFISVVTVVNGSGKTIVLMRAFGYSQKECVHAILGGYRPLSYIGFALGTVYQYVLLRIAVDVIFRDMEGVPEFHFDFPAMLISLFLFIVAYEMVMYCCSAKLKNVSIRKLTAE